ncbi:MULTISPECIES: M20 family metallopeptidase [Nocardia]|uniref:M20 family metallopeptidase n=1 Tax=Nocardia TaxID=1817 RepID=UPI0018956626|nr:MULTISPECIES: M20 family metallopeptidase [Nocardia]MBF6352003.1 M20 family metallopeptidase [Nocardia flavorosea]
MGNYDDILAGAERKLPDMLDRFRVLVDCESPSDDQRGLELCASLIRPWLAEAVERSARIERVGENVHILAEAPQPEVLILGHFDTVWPIGTTADWPFSITDGIASGPGTFDMKGGIVQAIAALELLADPSHVSVLLTSDEEVGSVSSRALIEEQARKAGAVLVCEPSADGGAVKIGRKGIANYRVTVTGRAAHAGLEPELGVNAGVELAHQILAIAGLASGETSVVPTVLTAGTTVNTVPESAQCAVDARSWAVSDLEHVDREMAALVPRLPGAAVRVSGGIDRPPFEESSSRDLYREAASAARELGFAPLPAVRSGGASDGNLTAAIGVPTLDGLGAVGGHPHARNEHVDVDAMPERVALLAVLLERLRHRSPTA